MPAPPDSDTIELGDVSVTRVVEWAGPIGTAREIIPAGRPEIWRDNRSLLVPDFWRPDDDACLCHVQSWVLRGGGRTIVIDTGVGNDRYRPQVPRFTNLHTPFLDDLARAGVRPADVDLVVNTHIHYDHVGWNTTRAGDRWVPTFPNATYLIPHADYDHFHPANAGRRPAPVTDADRLRREGGHLVFDDSIAPIVERGQALLWRDSYRIDGDLTLEPAPGHTPGSAVLWLRSGDDRAVFVGDLVHSPVQILEPHDNSRFCEDPVTARASRRRVLGQAADTGALVVPAHFGGHGATAVRRDGDGFAITGWAPFRTG
ncbi:MBL fold metallo-hydrolase [Actinomadura scrupuli]|uniref:MBL fold metallo-hydrolase n=1 Tax=Actinomadura scrupuli TaxID=559629 RepID=UPI003D99A96B